MASTQTANGSPVMAFTPVEFDHEVQPDAPPGEWEAICSVKKTKTKDDGYPMLQLDWKLEDTDNDEHKTFCGTTVPDFLVFFPKGHKGAKMSAKKLRQICELMDIDLDSVPTGKLSSWDNLEPFVEAVDKQRATIHTKMGKGRDGTPQTEVSYLKPAGVAASSGGDEEEEEEDETPKAKAKGKPAASARGKSARR